MTGLPTVTAVTISGAFVCGIVLVLLSSLQPLLVKRLNLNEGQAGGLIAAFHVVLAVMMLVVGFLVDRLGPTSFIVVGSLLAAVGILLLALSESGTKALCAILIAGAGGACLSIASSLLMSRAFFPDHEAASQNLGNVFFALGALLCPFLADSLIERLHFRRAVGLIAIVCLLPAILTAVTQRQAFPTAAQPGPLTSIFQEPVLWLASVVFFLYIPLEESLSTWAEPYLADLGFRERRATWLLTGFWLTFLAARLGAAYLQRHSPGPHLYSQGWLIVGLAIAAAVCLGNLAGARTRKIAILGILLLGACLGPIFPTLVGMLFDYFQSQRGLAYGTMFAIGTSSSLVIPRLIAAYGRRRTPYHAMRLPMIMAILLALVTLVLGLGWGS